MTTRADYYKDRKYDYLALRDVDTTKPAQLGLALYADDSSGQICAGIQKLAQRWMLEFLTERGSMPYLPDRGCEFMTLVRQGRLRTVADLSSAFIAADLTVSRNLKNEEYAGMPDDERFDNAELLSANLQPGFAELRVIVVSRAGELRTGVFPISTLPQV